MSKRMRAAALRPVDAPERPDEARIASQPGHGAASVFGRSFLYEASSYTIRWSQLWYPPLVQNAEEHASLQTRPAAGPTMVERAYEHLLAKLMSLEIAPGERIAIDTVARRLGIS